MIVIIDYGMGNLRSVSKAIEHLGASVAVSSSPKEISGARKLILPGVGAFGDAIQELQKRNLFAVIREYAGSGRPLLGICLGLQLFFEKSEESPGVEGLGIFKGNVVKFQTAEYKVPHMGWNQIALRNPAPILRDIDDGSFFYFVHSYYADPVDPQLTAAACSYAGLEFPAVINRGNVSAAQFHPEKSQHEGLRLLKNFVELPA